MEIGTYPLEKTSIFQGADAQQVQKMLGVILPSIKTYVRGETICRAGETVSSLGIVLAGARPSSFATRGATGASSSGLNPARYLPRRMPACPASR